MSAAARIPSFLVPVLIAAFFGAGAETDAYFIAYSAVLFLAGTVAQGLEQAVVPFAAQSIHRSGGTASRYLDGAASRAALTTAVVCVLGLPFFVAATSSGLRAKVVVYVLALIPLAIAWAAAAVYSGALVSQWRIAAATGSMLWRGIGAMIGIAAVPLGGGLWSVALGLGIGESLRAAWLKHHLQKELPSATGGSVASYRELSIAAGAQIGASAAIAMAPVVERLMAVYLGSGSVSHLEYAMRLLVVPSVFFEGALLPLLLARWTHERTHGVGQSDRRAILVTVAKGATVAILCGGVLAVFAGDLVRILLAHGRFENEDVNVVTGLLRLLAVAFVANMTAQMVEKHFIAFARNRVLAGLSLGRAIVRLGIAWGLLDAFGLRAFAIGFAVSDWFYLGALLLFLKSAPVPKPERA